jgi:hypothetical protein
MPENSVDVDRRIARLEKRVRGLMAVVLGLVVLLAFTAAPFLAARRSIVTRYLFTREFNVPPPSQWSTVSVSGGLAPAVDGKSITLWLAGGPLTNDRHQMRLELEHGGGQQIEMIDQKGQTRLRLASAADGAPSITLFGADGQAVWSAPVSASR